MKDSKVILDKTFLFGLRIVKLFIHLRETKVERELCIQILKCGTSIGANVEEACGDSSSKDFVNKLEIAYGKSRKTTYWLRILKDSNLLEEKFADSFIEDCDEITKILTSIINSSRNTNN